MAKANTNKVNKITVRMYRSGTGDFFILFFKSGNTVTFKLMIDCGCITGAKETIPPLVKNLAEVTGGIVDLLIVTHEHADHINGFEKGAEMFQNITIKKVWFAWTESTQDTIANDYRKKFAGIKMALNAATTRLNALQKEGYFEQIYDRASNQQLMLDGTQFFLDGLGDLQSLNGALPTPLSLDANQLPTMEDHLRTNKIIGAQTSVEFREPGEILENIPGAAGIRFYVLGPPKNSKSLNLEEAKGENFEQRPGPSTKDLAFTDALVSEASAALPFEPEHEWSSADDVLSDGEVQSLKMAYAHPDNAWRKIEHDWLFSAGGLALRYENSINNTSLVLAIQFIESGRVLLFPGDAELGNWLSWHDLNLLKNSTPGAVNRATNTKELLKKTVFYKVGHHLSQNGTAKGKGIDMMTSPELSAMATLDFKKINGTWLNTMPNDLLGAELIRKTKGKLFFTGDRAIILQNIKTERVAINQAHIDTLNALNEPFDGKTFIEVDVSG